MMQRQEQFQQEAQQQMQKAQADAMAPIYKKLDDAIKAVGAAEGVIYIFDLARTPVAYVNESQIIIHHEATTISYTRPYRSL